MRLVSSAWIFASLLLTQSLAWAQSPPLVDTSAFPGQWAPQAPDPNKPNAPQLCQRLAQSDAQLACYQYLGADWARLQRFGDANARLAPPVKGEKRVVFIGDSITDLWSLPTSGGFFPGKPYINRGIGSQTTAQMLVRFRPDVLALQPRVVVILAGTNDIAGRTGPTTLASIQDNLSSMVELALAHKIKVVLASLLPVGDDKRDRDGKPQLRSQERPLATIRALNDWIAAYAKKKQIGFIDYHKAMVGPDGQLRPELNDDGVHPNQQGYAVMAPLAEAAITLALRGR